MSGHREVPKVRLVKCPKCRRLLVETPDLPVYECGGCGIVLQAKILKNDANDTKMDLPESTSRTSENGSRKDQPAVFKVPGEVSSSADIKVSTAADVAAAAEQMDHAQEITVPGSDNVISAVTSETTDQTTPDSDLNGALDDRPAPTTRSVSSSDESEAINQVLYPPVEVHKMFKDKEFAGVQERLMNESGKFPMNEEVQDQARSSSSSDIPDYIMRCSEWSGAQPPKHPRNAHQMRLDDNESSLTVPFYLKNEIPSTPWHDEFLDTSGLCSPENPSKSRQEKIRLLRMVYKLQDQLDKTYVSRERNVPTRGAYRDHEAFREEWYNGSGPIGHSRHPRSYKEIDEWSRHSRSSQLPFHGEAIDRDRFQTDHQYQYPHCYIEPRRINHARNCYSGVQSSRPSFHQPRTSSTVPSRSYSKSDDLGYRADERRKFYSRELVNASKKHCRPIADGAPFISCYQCLQPLKLPADFLLFKRRCHKLRCAACRAVLNFSLGNHNHILPFVPGNVDDHSKMTYGNASAPGEARKKPSFFKNPVDSDVEAGPKSSKSLSMKKRQARGNTETARNVKTVSRLHRLMGYTSASELLRSGSGS